LRESEVVLLRGSEIATLKILGELVEVRSELVGCRRRTDYLGEKAGGDSNSRHGSNSFAARAGHDCSLSAGGEHDFNAVLPIGSAGPRVSIVETIYRNGQLPVVSTDRLIRHHLQPVSQQSAVLANGQLLPTPPGSGRRVQQVPILGRASWPKVRIALLD
jgi:hypothetical protein